SIDGAQISAYPVPHGRAPSLAFRIDGPGFSVVFASDQGGTDAGFASFARNADVLVLHTALSPRAVGHPFAKVIGLPQTLGRLAKKAGAKRVLLTNLMAFPKTPPSASSFSLWDADAVFPSVRPTFGGEVQRAFDPECIPLERSSRR